MLCILTRFSSFSIPGRRTRTWPRCSSKLQENLKSLGAEVGKAESWGKRRLAYDIRKQREGTYAVIECSAVPAVIKEFERQLGLNEQVLRFLSTRIPAKKRVRSAAKQQPAAATAVEEVV